MTKLDIAVGSSESMGFPNERKEKCFKCKGDCWFTDEYPHPVRFMCGKCLSKNIDKKGYEIVDNPKSIFNGMFTHKKLKEMIKEAYRLDKAAG